MREHEGLSGTVTDLRREPGGPDILINNAGATGPTEDTDPADFDTVVDASLRGTFRATRHAVPLFKDS